MHDETQGDVGLLIQADRAAQAAWSEAISNSMSSRLEAQRIKAMLQHPFWRHLLELYLNDSVTVFGAQILGLAQLAQRRETVGRTERFKGVSLLAVDLNEKGIRLVQGLQGDYGGTEWFDSLVAGITSYACRDTGQGVCLGSEHLATAIENQDREILIRLVDPLDQTFLCEDAYDLPTLAEQARLDTQAFWSPRHEGRTSAKVALSHFECNEPAWTSDAYEGLIDFAIETSFITGIR